MREDEGRLRLDPVPDASALETLVEHVFADPEARRGMGWQPDEDPEQAMEAIGGLWHHRFENGWRVYTVVREDRRIGLAGLGPIEDDGSAWWAVYLRERGEGVGPTVGRRLIAQASEQGATEMIAVTWEKNRASIAMLEKLGFSPVGPARYEWAEQSALVWIEHRLRL